MISIAVVTPRSIITHKLYYGLATALGCMRRPHTEHTLNVGDTIQIKHNCWMQTWKLATDSLSYYSVYEAPLFSPHIVLAVPALPEPTSVAYLG